MAAIANAPGAAQKRISAAIPAAGSGSATSSIYDGDTLFRRLPITPRHLDASGKRFEIDLRDELIVLEPAHFYLGFAFRTKPVPRNVSFPFYYTRGGEGAMLFLFQHRWSLSAANVKYVFPFRMQYVETGSRN